MLYRHTYLCTSPWIQSIDLDRYCSWTPDPLSTFRGGSRNETIAGDGVYVCLVISLQQIAKVLQQESELHKPQCNYPVWNHAGSLVLINCPIVVLHYQFLVARLLQSAITHASFSHVGANWEVHTSSILNNVLHKYTIQKNYNNP